MAISLQNRISQRRALGARINWGHPLLRDVIGLWLFNEGGGGSRNHCKETFYARQNWGANNYWQAGEYGQCINYGLSASWGTLGSTTDTKTIALAAFSNAIPFTFYSMIAGFNRDTAQGFMCTRSGGGTLIEFGTDRSGINLIHLQMKEQTGGGATLTGTKVLYNYPPNQAVHLVGTNDTVNQYLYVDGEQDATAVAGTWTTSPNEIDVAGQQNGLISVVGKHLFNALWRRGLSKDEVKWLASEPLDFILPPLYRKYFVVDLSHLTATLGDDLNSGPWKDDISLIGGDPDFQLALGDNIQNLTEALRLVGSYEEAISDSYNNLSDALGLTVGLPIELFDSNQFNWADFFDFALIGFQTLTLQDDLNNWADFISVLALAVVLSVTLTDQMNNMADAASINIQYRIQLRDLMAMTDRLVAMMSHLLTITDQANNMSDALSSIQYGTQSPFADDMNNMGDSISIALLPADGLTLDLSDSMNNMADSWQDSVNPNINLLDYIRAHMNDV